MNGYPRFGWVDILHFQHVYMGIRYYDLDYILKCKYFSKHFIFSKSANEEVLTPEVIETFKDNWDWHALSGNQNLQLSCQNLEKYADSMDWEKIISRWDCKLFDESGIDFYEKFREYIPASKLQGSYLWDEMVEQQKKSLIREIIS